MMVWTWGEFNDLAQVVQKVKASVWKRTEIYLNIAP